MSRQYKQLEDYHVAKRARAIDSNLLKLGPRYATWAKYLTSQITSCSMYEMGTTSQVCCGIYKR